MLDQENLPTEMIKWNATQLIPEVRKLSPRQVEANHPCFRLPRMQRPGLPPKPYDALFQVENLIDTLRSHLSALVDLHSTLLIWMSTISGIPDDIIIEIFQHVVNEDPNSITCLRRVCKRWRYIVNSTPTLWTVIKLNGSDGRYILSAIFGKIDEYGRRSSGLSIKVILDFLHCSSIGDASAVIKRLLPHLNRCVTFKISALNWDWLRVSYRCWDVLRGTLQHVTLCIYSMDLRTEDLAWVPLLTGDFPLLDSLTLTRVPPALIAAHMPNLTVLDVSSNLSSQVVTNALFDIILSSVNLKDLRLGAVGAREVVEAVDTDFDNSHHTHLSTNISSLSFDRISSPAINRFLGLIRVPCLEILTARLSSASKNGGGLHWLLPLTFQSDAGMLPHFRHLELHHIYVSMQEQKELVNYLRRFSHLENFAISSASTSRSTVIHSFFWHLNNRGVLPNLKALWIKECGNIYRILLDIITRRNDDHSSRRIHSLRITDIEIPISLRDKLEKSVMFFEFDKIDLSF